MIDRRTLLSASTSGVVLGALPGLGGAMARAAEAPPARQGVAMSDGAPLSPDMPVPFGRLLDPLPPADPSLRRLDDGWRFLEGDIAVAPPRGNDDTYAVTKTGNAPGAAGQDFDDGDWASVRLPHDWAIQHPIEADQNNAWGYRRRGVGWYRRTLRLEEAWRGRYLELQLGGMATNATVWFNGIPVAHSFSGYVQQNIDITPFARYGEEANVIAIRVDAQAMEGWWYEGAGLYRECALAVRPALHIATDGIHADPRPAAPGQTGGTWTVPVRVTLNNAGGGAEASEPVGPATIDVRLIAPDGRELARGQASASPAALATVEAGCDLAVTDPALWSTQAPLLHTLEVDLLRNGQVIDRRRLRLGFRTIRFDANKGFFLNGKPLKIKGVCIHQDHAGVGVALPDALVEWRVRRLQDIGCNAIRSSHHAPSLALLDACDRLGMLVMDENRHFNPSADYAAHLRWMVRRDRNRPSVIMWSVLNEEPMQGSAQGYEMVRRLAAVVKELDDSRPVTAAMNDGFFTPLNGADAVDLVGFNYRAEWYDRYHAAHPDRPIISTEDTSAVMTRGEWRNDEQRNVLGSYDTNAPEWGLTHTESWRRIGSRPFMGATFVWTGFDYHGEPTPLPWPAASSSFGILDLCGFAKMAYHIRRAQWLDGQPVIAIGPHWNWPGREGQAIQVMVPTNAAEAELFLNGASLGRKTVDPFAAPSWQVPYAPGRLEAVGYAQGREVARARVETTGAPVRLRLTADRAMMAGTGRDVQPVSVDLLDSAGRHVPTATDRVTFTLTGGGEIIGVGNGDANDHDSEQASSRRLYAGLAQVLVRAPAGQGRLTLTAQVAAAGGAGDHRLCPAGQRHARARRNPGAQPVSEWRRTAFAATLPDGAQALARSDWRALSYVRAGRLEEAPATPGYTLLQTRLTPRRDLALRGGRVAFASVAGKAQLWVDGTLVARKADAAPGPLAAALPPGEQEHVISLVLEAQAGEAVGLARSVWAWPA
ncbi:beta-galactosidase GalA [Novosphingobium pokkalii]|uniref:beta-galactosidase GalA n=1 Tax=Novosphingobium pokkalii TaxID=1770194 RepID=UPI00363298B9